MTTHLFPKAYISQAKPSHQLTILLALVSGIYMTNTLAETPIAQENVATSASANNLETLVGPIALYPDDLVAIILPASTNPLQIVQAERFLEKRKADPKLAIDDGWDDAVKSLLNYPDVIQKMNNDLDWTTALGEAVVTDQGAVLEAVQVFRRKSQSAGNLKSDTKQTIVVEKEVIKIVPADPQVIYVPQYNPTTVVVTGSPPPAYYPTPYPVYYYPYPPGAAFATGLIWGAAIGAAWNGGHYHADYHGGSANINIDRSNNVNINNPGGSGQRPGGGGSSQWQPKAKSGQVGRTTGNTSASARPGQTPANGASRSAGAQPRASTQPAGGSRGGDSSLGGSSSGRQTQMDSSRGGSRGGDSALGGYSSGRETKMDSSRGASSRESMSRGSRGSFSGGGSGRSRSGGRR